MDFEILTFDFKFTSKYNKIPPNLKIMIDNECVTNVAVEDSYHIKYDKKLFFEDHNIKIIKSGKTNDDPDQALIIETIMVDNINLQRLVYNNSIFYPCYPEPWATQQIKTGNALQNSVIGDKFLGHDGTWNLSFSSPFYKFLIKEIG